MTWDEISTKVLADCGRCCCLCRRFKPIQLQVHHIVLKSEGGEDELDNAIALCLTCHTDVHTKAPFTRRFTVEELKAHRENVYRLVAEGKLPAGKPVETGADEMPLAVAEAVSGSSRRGAGFDLIPTAVRVLVVAASSDGMVMVYQPPGGGLTVHVGGRSLVDEDFNTRHVAEYRHAVEQLEQHGLIAPTDLERERFRVTHPGYLLADELQAEGGYVPDE
jgi:hypothetical protein